MFGRKRKIRSTFCRHYLNNTANLVTENMGLETPENLAWPIFFGTGRISWVIPIIKEKWGYRWYSIWRRHRRFFRPHPPFPMFSRRLRGGL